MTSVRLPDLQLLQRERKTQTNSNWGENRKNPFTFLFRGEKHPIMEWTFFTWREADLMLQRQNTTAAAYFFNFLLSSLSVAASRQFLFRFSHDCGQLPACDVVLVPPQPPPSASLSAASSKLERYWRALSQCKCVLNSTRGSGRKNPLLFFWVHLSLCCASALLE